MEKLENKEMWDYIYEEMSKEALIDFWPNT